MADITQKNVTGWVGWVYFAAFMILLSGAFQAIIGLVALFNNTIIVSGEESVWLFNIATWGWLHLLLGVILIFTGFNLFSGGMWGRAAGVVLVSLSAIANFTFLPVYPLWSLVVLVLDALILYALIAHGDEAKV